MTPEDKGNTQQVVNPTGGIEFNFCEAPLPNRDPCPAGDYYAFFTDGSGVCHGLKSSDEKANTVAVEMTNG